MPKFRLILEPMDVFVNKGARTWEFNAETLKKAVNIAEDQYIDPNTVELIMSRVGSFEQYDPKEKRWIRLADDVNMMELKKIKKVL